MQVTVNSYGYSAMMSKGHHFFCAHTFISILSADVIRVMSAFSVLARGIIGRIKEILFYNIQEYAYDSA